MVVPFGFSVGDFIAGIKLLKSVVYSLSDARGAKADYSELRQTLDVLEKALDAAGEFSAPQHQIAVGDEVANCKECVKRFLVGFKKFELLKSGRGGTNRVQFAVLQIQYSLTKKDDVRKFRDHLEVHVSALQLQLAVFQISAQFQDRKIAKSTRADVHSLATRLYDSTQLQESFSEEMKNLHNAQQHSLADVQACTASSSQAISTLSFQMDEIQRQMKHGLSPDMQHTMFRLLQEALADKDAMKRTMDQLVVQQKSIQTHLVEVKGMVQVHQEIPAQMLSRRPVILIDAFDENRLPFHLDFINSFEALFAVLEIRFKEKGYHALVRIRRQLFVMYEHCQQKQIDLNGAWANAFKPGQIVEMSMIVTATPNVKKTLCPACGHIQRGKAGNDNRMDCGRCPMMYRWPPLSGRYQRVVARSE
ncbi:hypothetical protein HBI56_157010 [Parastagonospora nodorum]|nr:hypothetical protein HBH49_201400 [Parastagonospora nodorum]KAH4077100.1 hypothetical protein HBH46_244510 [Parastagonospora nodorum]KAH4254285.1 hypothetical protein HBI03_184690 [Parastagonospora nodorum]KAH4298564.1 hypothetical protein HBI01_131060 [Parastagonospora nodorum]KAH4319104.1 hypothetical protein HBI02_010650 [Parastagonospora nodorum]